MPANDIGLPMSRPSADVQMPLKRPYNDAVEDELAECSYHFYENIHSMSNIFPSINFFQHARKTELPTELNSL